MMNKSLILPFSVFTLFLFLFVSVSLSVEALREDVSGLGPLVKRKHRRSLVVTEYGEISAVKISDGTRGPFHLEFVTLEPNALFLPVLLHADMVFYVDTGTGKLSWADEDKIKMVNLKRGDIYRLQAGSVFFVQSNLEAEREKLRFHAIFSNTDEDIYKPVIGTYSSISDLILGFDKKVLQAAFKVPEDVIEAIRNATKPPAIVHAMPTKETNFWVEARFLKAFLGDRGGSLYPIHNNKRRAYNILDANKDFKNSNGWSITVTRKDLHLLKGSNIGVFMVNLTKGSMMGPHWNPMATEIGIVLHGEGMVRVVCSSSANESEFKNMTFKVQEGDVFAVPRFHPMAQMSFLHDSFVFMGFSTTTKRNYPQFLTGKRSVLHVLNKEILAVSFNVTSTTIDQLLVPQKDSIILDCPSCAEEEERKMKEEIEKEREEEKKTEEEEAKRREEEKKRKKEEEEARKRKEEEEARKREEEEAKKREEEEARKREEEEAKKREEEAARKRKEEEAKKREEEEAKKKEQEEAKKREEEEARKERERQQEVEERRKREEAAKREQEEAKRQEEERERRSKQEEEQATKKEQQEEAARQPEEKEREGNGGGGGGGGK